MYVCHLKRTSTKVMSLANKFHSKNIDSQTQTICLVSGVFVRYLRVYAQMFVPSPHSKLCDELSNVKIDLTEAHKESFAHCQNPMNYYNHIYTLF